MRSVGKIVIDESVIEGHSQPYIVYKSEEARTAAVDEPRRASGSGHH
jgi:hypothetical protein